MSNFEYQLQKIYNKLQGCTSNRDVVFLQAVNNRLDKQMRSYLSELQSFERQLNRHDELTAAKKLNKVMNNGCIKRCK